MSLIYLIPFISAFIGWFTNWVAIKMLFHPKEPVKILGITFIGIFPKRQAQFAEKLGKLVSAELLSFQDIEQKITNPRNLEALIPQIDAHIDHFLRVKLADHMPIISMFIGDQTIAQMKTVFMAELQELFPSLLKSYMGHLQSQLDLEKIVIEKVKGFSSEKLEQILNDIMSREFRFIEILGGVLGFIIGIIQVLLTMIA
ncbi:MAG: hypothetical protein RI983_981 [Bacteroidota bacterium]|jgi:uncharacterized membrane protein YheB (UPF0754 family)